MQSAVTAATEAGALVVAAAGNNNADAAAYFPGNCDGVLTVAGTDARGSRAWYSNYGTTVDIAAPGGDSSRTPNATVLSTFNGGAQAPGAATYATKQGTSMATPHVAGAAALLLSAEPTLTPAQVRQRLLETATPFPRTSALLGSSTFDCVAGQPCGAGIVNAAAALGVAVPEPPADGTRTWVRLPADRTWPEATCRTYPVTVLPKVGAFTAGDAVTVNLRDATGVRTSASAAAPGDRGSITVDLGVCATDLAGSTGPYAIDVTTTEPPTAEPNPTTAPAPTPTQSVPASPAPAPSTPPALLPPARRPRWPAQCAGTGPWCFGDARRSSGRP